MNKIQFSAWTEGQDIPELRVGPIKLFLDGGDAEGALAAALGAGLDRGIHRPRDPHQSDQTLGRPAQCGHRAVEGCGEGAVEFAFRHGHGAVAEAGNHARRDAHAPVPRRVQHVVGRQRILIGLIRAQLGRRRAGMSRRPR